ncbi:MAG TPA: response regulator transcription factor [Candidatus Stackebrandtia excrementipullorum]|nr:response regulator transcription factor [Candidatus Stackebrandtia excrementipullorum]
MTDILVVDDHEIVREGLSASLSGPTTNVAAAVGRGDEALAMLAERPVDVAVVDLRLPDMSGHDLIRRLKKHHPDLRIIVLSTYLSEESVRQAREAGADDYVAKSAGMAELRACLERVVAGGSSAETPAQLVRRQGGGDTLRLTPQQEKVLVLAASGATDREIATTLFLSESTVRFHLQRLKVLLGARSKTQVIAEAFRRELIRPEPL